MLSSHQQEKPQQIVAQCKAVLNDITFPDLATRRLFEQLINQTEHTAQLLGEQKIL